MKRQSIHFAFVLMLGGVALNLQTVSAQVTPTTAPDPQAMMQAMQAAQADASKPGDEALNCDRLQEQLVAVTEDPTLQAHLQSAGMAAQQDQAAQAEKGQVAMQTVQTIIASMVPGAGMATISAAAAAAPTQQAQTAERVQSRMAQAQQMMVIMPKLLRGQRLIELASAKKCEWAAGLDSGGAVARPDK
jgi:hypothetical protein